MGYNLSYKLCILNSVVIHLGMKIIDIADKYRTCVSMLWRIVLIDPYPRYSICTVYLCSAQSDSIFLKIWKEEKKRKNKGIKHPCTYMLIDCNSWLMEVVISDKYFMFTGIIWSTCCARNNFRIYIFIICLDWKLWKIHIFKN